MRRVPAPELRSKSLVHGGQSHRYNGLRSECRSAFLVPPTHPTHGAAFGVTLRAGKGVNHQCEPFLQGAHNVRVQLAIAKWTHVNQHPRIVATQRIQQPLGHGHFFVRDIRRIGGSRCRLNPSIQGLFKRDIDVDRALGCCRPSHQSLPFNIGCTLSGLVNFQ